MNQGRKRERVDEKEIRIFNNRRKQEYLENINQEISKYPSRL